GDGLVWPGALTLMIKLARLRREHPDPVLDVAAQGVFAEVAAHRQGKVNRIRLKPDLLERLGTQHPQLAMTLRGDAVHSPRREPAVLLGPQGFDQSLGR